MRFSSSRAATSATEASGLTVTTGELMMSLACIFRFLRNPASRRTLVKKGAGALDVLVQAEVVLEDQAFGQSAVAGGQCGDDGVPHGGGLGGLGLVRLFQAVDCPHVRGEV